MVVSLPLCKALKQGLPQTKITMVASVANACIADTCQYIDETVIKPRRLMQWLKLLHMLRAKKYDVAIDLNHAVTPHTIFAIRLVNPRHVASPFKDGRWGVKGVDLQLFDLMPAQHPLKYARPIAETYLDIARLLDCSTDGCIPYPLLNWTKPENIPDNYVILNPSGSRASMKLQEADMSAIIQQIRRLNSSLRILIPALPEEHERLKKQYQNIPMVDILKPSASIEPILSLIQFSKLVITPDTALVHIACAFGIPLVAVYTNDKALFAQWQPYPSNKAAVVHSNASKGLSGYSLADLLCTIADALSSLNGENAYVDARLNNQHRGRT